MRQVLNIVSKAFVKQFYQENTGFFLLTIGLLFGFLKTPQHVDLASFLALNPIFLLIPFTLWIAYSMKVVVFFKRKRRQLNYSWVGYLSILNNLKMWYLSVYIAVQLLAPIVGYTLFLIAISVRLNQYNSVGFLLAGLLFICLVVIRIINREVYRISDQTSSLRILGLSWIPKGIPFHYIHWVLTKRGSALLFTKVCSIAILIGSIIIYKVDEVDPRLLYLGILLSTGINAILAYNGLAYEREKTAIFINLPIKKFKRFSFQVTTALILMIPESMILVSYLQDSILLILKCELFAVGFMLFMRNLNYMTSIGVDRFVMLVFLVVSILFFVVLGYAEPIILGLLGLLCAFLFFVKSRLTN